MSPPLEGKVAIITGAGGGIGAAAAMCFAAAGARVLAVDRVPDRLPVASAEVQPFLADVSDASACGAAIAEATRRWGALHVLFNVAGISGRRLGDGPVHECSEEGWDAVLDANLRSVFLMCRAAVPALLDAGGGAIVNLASVLGLVGGGDLFATHAYAASKAGVVGLTRAIAIYYAPRRVRANVLCPGLVDTPMAARALADPPTAAHAARMQPLLAGPAAPEQVAAAALFLASDAASAITGAVLPVDGGWTAQ
jgi:meso-butanediol dehydrogenase/(S,S)-butanediol dehydrogenase/diacetyl reductase